MTRFCADDRHETPCELPCWCCTLLCDPDDTVGPCVTCQDLPALGRLGWPWDTEYCAPCADHHAGVAPWMNL